MDVVTALRIRTRICKRSVHVRWSVYMRLRTALASDSEVLVCRFSLVHEHAVCMSMKRLVHTLCNPSLGFL